MTNESERTVGKTPAMAFVLDYMRQFPGADFQRVKKAALAAGLPAPHPVLYGNALRVIKLESHDPNDPAPPPRARGRGRAGRALKGVTDLAGLVEQMKDVVEERDRLRAALDQVATVIRRLR